MQGQNQNSLTLTQIFQAFSPITDRSAPGNFIIEDNAQANYNFFVTHFNEALTHIPEHVEKPDPSKKFIVYLMSSNLEVKDTAAEDVFGQFNVQHITSIDTFPQTLQPLYNDSTNETNDVNHVSYLYCFTKSWRRNCTVTKRQQQQQQPEQQELQVNNSFMITAAIKCVETDKLVAFYNLYGAATDVDVHFATITTQSFDHFVVNTWQKRVFNNYTAFNLQPYFDPSDPENKDKAYKALESSCWSAYENIRNMIVHDAKQKQISNDVIIEYTFALPQTPEAQAKHKNVVYTSKLVFDNTTAQLKPGFQDNCVNATNRMKYFAVTMSTLKQPRHLFTAKLTTFAHIWTTPDNKYHFEFNVIRFI